MWLGDVVCGCDSSWSPDRDEACWKNTPVPPAPPEGEKQMTEKPNYEQRRVLIRLAVVHKRECGAFLRRSIVKVE